MQRQFWPFSRGPQLLSNYCCSIIISIIASLNSIITINSTIISIMITTTPGDHICGAHRRRDVSLPLTRPGAIFNQLYSDKNIQIKNWNKNIQIEIFRPKIFSQKIQTKNIQSKHSDKCYSDKAQPLTNDIQTNFRLGAIPKHFCSDRFFKRLTTMVDNQHGVCPENFCVGRLRRVCQAVGHQGLPLHPDVHRPREWH